MFDQKHLENLVKSENYVEAVDYCYAALTLDIDRQHWKTQLGYVCFLDEGNDEGSVARRYIQSIDTFRELTGEYPHDANTYFWLGYIQLILYPNTPEEEKYVQQALSYDPQHPYANLVICSYLTPQEQIKRLQIVLEQQPNNYRALDQLANNYITLMQIDLARQTLATILTHDPYYESHYGVMNQYINEVLTQASNRQKAYENAEAKIKLLPKVEIH